MRNLSRHILREIVHAVFKGLPEMDGLRASDASEDGAGTTPGRRRDDAGATPAKPRALPAEERRVNPMNTSNTINATIVILLILLKLE